VSGNGRITLYVDIWPARKANIAVVFAVVLLFASLVF
jgi:hypothetical protein